ncbi:hypothetical protein MMC07_004107 [Pseudocyphellaria aurata]|nr:hypothetical protein [Pseudocyphellaria aurata]
MEDDATLLRASENASSLSQTNNNCDNTGTVHNLRLSLNTATATPLPDSSPIASHVPSPSSSDQPQSPSSRRTERSITPSSQGLSGPPRSRAFRPTPSNTAAVMAPKSVLPPTPEKPTESPVTAAAVAQEFFQRELEAHGGTCETPLGPETVVILQDNCYGHRFSRPRTSKGALSTIVERPERIHASILGAAIAYVRLGGRHAKGAAAPHPKKTVDKLPPIPFRFHKTTRTLPLTSPAATAVHGTKWMRELSMMCDSAEKNLALNNGKELIRPDAQAGSNGNGSTVQPKLHEGDLYLCSESLSALEGALGGVCEGVDAVFAERGPKRAFVCIRPPGHHCSADYPSGFCWLNNVHVGIGHASITHGLTHAAIIDFDLHHGDGSQSIAWAHNSRIASLPKNTPHSKKTAIGYFSLHDINSYPCESGDVQKVQNASLCLENAHGQTTWNVHLQSWKTEAEFWELYEHRYMVLISKARAFLRSQTDRLRSALKHPQPKAAIFLSAGFDASEWESPDMQRHQVNVPTDFYARFTHDVVQLAEEEGLGVDGRVISVLEGGYSDRALMSGVLSHLSGLAATSKPTAEVKVNNGLGYEMGRRLGKLDLNGDGAQESQEPRGTFNEMIDSRWWALPRLEEVENLVNPPVRVVAARKRNATPPTYSSATQSYMAKTVSPPQARRSSSGLGTHVYPSTASSARPITPPSPDVDWMIAAYELSKLLIPSDRETRSCKPEELNAKASHARRERHSTIGYPIVPPEGQDMTAQKGAELTKQPRRRLSEFPQDPAVVKAAKRLPRVPARYSAASKVPASNVESKESSELSLRSSKNPQSSQIPAVVKVAKKLSRVPAGYSAASKTPTATSASPPDQMPPPDNGDVKPDAMTRLNDGIKYMDLNVNKSSGTGKANEGSDARPRSGSPAPITKKSPEASKVNAVGKRVESGKIPSPIAIRDETEVSAEVPAHAVDPQQSAPEFPGASESLLHHTFKQGRPIPPRENLTTPEGQNPLQLPTPSFLAPTTSSILAYDATIPAVSSPPGTQAPPAAMGPPSSTRTPAKENLPVFTPTSTIIFGEPKFSQFEH